MSSSPVSPLIVCCPVCGSRACDFPGSLSLGGCPDWVCPDCGASGVLSGGLSDDAELFVYDWPGWSGFGVPLRRSVWDCVVPMVFPADDACGCWDAGGGAGLWSVCAPSGVSVGYVRCGSDGVWVAENWRGECAYAMLLESADDLREWVASGCIGAFPVGSFIALE